MAVAVATSQYVQLDGSMSIPDANWTIAGWVRFPSGVTGNRVIFENLTGPYTNFLRLRSQNGTPNFTFADGDGTTIAFSTYTDFSGNTSWRHVALVRTTNTVALWIDGTQVGDGTNASIGAIADLSPLRFGASGYDLDALGGELAEWAFWTRALSGTEIGQLYDGGEVAAVALAPSYLPTNLSWYYPMHSGDYTEEVGGLSVTNNGTTGATHPDIAYPGIEFEGSAAVSFDGTADTIRNLFLFEGNAAVNLDGTADTVRNLHAFEGEATVLFDGTASTIRNLWLFDGTAMVSFDGVADTIRNAWMFSGEGALSCDGQSALKQIAALGGEAGISFDGEAALDIAALVFEGQGLLGFDGSIATLNLILAFQAQAALSFGGEARLGQEALFEGGGALSFDGLADLTAFQWEGVDVPVNPSWSDVD